MQYTVDYLLITGISQVDTLLVHFCCAITGGLGENDKEILYTGVKRNSKLVSNVLGQKKNHPSVHL